MPELGKMRDRGCNARRRVDQDPRNSLDVAIDQHQRPTRRIDPDLRFVQTGRGEHKPLHLADEAAEQQFLTGGILVRIAQKDA